MAAADIGDNVSALPPPRYASPPSSVITSIDAIRLPEMHYMLIATQNRPMPTHFAAGTTPPHATSAFEFRPISLACLIIYSPCTEVHGHAMILLSNLYWPRDLLIAARRCFAIRALLAFTPVGSTILEICLEN